MLNNCHFGHYYYYYNLHHSDYHLVYECDSGPYLCYVFIICEFLSCHHLSIIRCLNLFSHNYVELQNCIASLISRYPQSEGNCGHSNRWYE